MFKTDGGKQREEEEVYQTHLCTNIILNCVCSPHKFFFIPKLCNSYYRKIKLMERIGSHKFWDCLVGPRGIYSVPRRVYDFSWELRFVQDDDRGIVLITVGRVILNTPPNSRR